MEYIIKINAFIARLCRQPDAYYYVDSDHRNRCSIVVR